MSSSSPIVRIPGITRGMGGISNFVLRGVLGRRATAGPIIRCPALGSAGRPPELGVLMNFAIRGLTLGS